MKQATNMIPEEIMACPIYKTMQIFQGLVNRVQYNEIPPHVEYSATESARDLADVFRAMWDWGEKHASPEVNKSNDG